NDRNSWDEQNGWWAYDAPWLNAGSNSLSVKANIVTFNNDIGSLNPLSSLIVKSSDTLNLNVGVRTLNLQQYTSPTIVLGHNAALLGFSETIAFNTDSFVVRNPESILNKGGILLVDTYTNGASIGLGSGRGLLSLPEEFFSDSRSLFGGFYRSLVIGSSNTGDITIGGNISLFNSTNIISGGNVTITSDGLISNTGGNTTLVLDASGNFKNLSGPSAITNLGDGSRWVIYSQNPDKDQFNGLVSGSIAYWGSNSQTLDPSLISGNAYVFNKLGVVTITTTNDSKVYGQTKSIVKDYEISGSPISANIYGDVFLNTQFDSIYTGVLEITSSGSGAKADVLGGPYTIKANGLTALPGFKINYDNSGLLTITPATVSLSAVKTYDSYNTFTGSQVTITTGVGDQTLTYSGATSNSPNVANASYLTAITLGDCSGVVCKGTASNYQLPDMTAASASNAVTINKAHLTVVANDALKTYGDANPTLSTTVRGFVLGQNLASSGL
ncbi:MBG domain-containing protein, partial [Polynucleobacter sp. JS-Polo-80-F4]|uniref:MBG domain-containing protein n=1 Tax=Polynucleobacter sp. JS-Polo-80-F4 TaxID=2576918 RepID=UPI001C0DCA63